MLGPRQKQLVDALRSGKFIQGREHLETSIDNVTRYCCLGVSCKIAEESGIPLVYDLEGKLLGGTLLAQPNVKRWFGFMGNSGTISGSNSLTNLNDHVGLNFCEIADSIEKHACSIFTGPL